MAGLKPNELGKMNGALNASVNAVLAHIKNGQTTNGPVGLMAGLAVADAGSAAASAAVAGLIAEQQGYTDLQTAVTAAGYPTVADYLAAKAAGTATAAQTAAVDPLIAAVGGTDATGLGLANTPPTPEEIAAAEAEAVAALGSVTAAETGIAEAWNKDGDIDTLLSELRGRLSTYTTEISATLAGLQPVTNPVAVQPETEVLPVIE